MGCIFNVGVFYHSIYIFGRCFGVDSLLYKQDRVSTLSRVLWLGCFFKWFVAPDRFCIGCALPTVACSPVRWSTFIFYLVLFHVVFGQDPEWETVTEISDAFIVCFPTIHSAMGVMMFTPSNLSLVSFFVHIQAHKRCSDRVPCDCLPDIKQLKRVFGVDLTSLTRAERK